MSEYYIVDTNILPSVYEKVIAARSLIQNGEVNQVSEAVKKVGISRGTYYKYKDYVFLPSQGMNERKAVISFMLHDSQGALVQVLQTMSTLKASILTINQNIPIHGWASLVISFDYSQMGLDLDTLYQNIKNCKGVSKFQLLALE